MAVAVETMSIHEQVDKDAPPPSENASIPHVEQQQESIQLRTIPTGTSTILPIPSESNKAQRRSEFAGMAALVWTFFLAGWNDGTAGPMLPAMQKHFQVKGLDGPRRILTTDFKIGFALVSLIFVVNCVVCLSFSRPPNLVFNFTLTSGIHDRRTGEHLSDEQARVWCCKEQSILLVVHG